MGKDIPTLTAEGTFDPNSDAAELRKAMKGLGTDEAAIINIIARRTSSQRQKISEEYQGAFGRVLIDDLKSELNGELEDVIVALMTPLARFLAKEVNESLDGLGTSEKALAEIICSRNNYSIKIIKEVYQDEFGKSMEEAIAGDTHGHFQRLMVAMCAASRDETSCDFTLAPDLAQKLFEAEADKWGTDEDEFTRIMVGYSYPLLRRVFKEYEKLSGKTFKETIEAEVSGGLKEGFLAIYNSIENRIGFFAQGLQDALAGAGTNDRTLIRLIVSRCEIDLGNIKREYQKMFERTLEEAIEGDTSGDYKRILLVLLEE